MAYDPFARGPYPVGVRTAALADAVREGRRLTIELWYPAAESHRGDDLHEDRRDRYAMLPGLEPVPQDAVRDAAPRAGRYPVVVFSHGHGSHRRQSTFLCTHLASHGHVVAACDHVGNTVFDVLRHAMARRRGTAPPGSEVLATTIALRPGDVRAVVAALTEGSAGDLAAHVAARHVGVTGHSFGGWTALMAPRDTPSVRAVLGLAPAGGDSPLRTEQLTAALDFAWGRDVPTLFVVADRDTLLPLDGMRALFDRVPSPSRRMVVLHETGHMHFCDRAAQTHELFRSMPLPGKDFAAVAAATPPIDELADPAATEDAVRGLATAHFAAALHDDGDAARFLAGDLVAVLAARGVRASVA